MGAYSLSGLSFSANAQRGSGDCGNVSFESTAFDDAMTDDRLIVFAKDYAAPLASRRRETLRLTQGADGLDVEFDLPDTQAARDLIASNRNVPLIIRPLFEKADSKFVNDVQSGVSTYSSVAVRALLIGSTDASKGWPPSEIIGPPTETEAPDMVYLSPWPDPDAEAEAIDSAWSDFKTFLSGNVPGSASERARVAALGKASAALVENFAPGAPKDLKDEAVIRTSGWLSQIPTGIVSEAITIPALLMPTLGPSRNGRRKLFTRPQARP